MSSKLVVAAFLLLLAFPLILPSWNLAIADTQYPHLTDQESRIISSVNGTSAYDYDLELERITLDPNISGYSFRSAGSPGANQSANWIKNQFETLGLEVSLESYEFTNWYLPSQPTFVLNVDGNTDNVNDQVTLKSFQAAHYSWPTTENGTAGKVVFLPLPENLTRSVLPNAPINTIPASWNNVDLTGKIVVVGMEVSMNSLFSGKLEQMLSNQPPAALVYTYWYDWMNFTPPSYSSIQGYGRWSQHLPVGWIDYQDGLWLRNVINENTFATVKIPAKIENGTNYNVVARLKGSTDPGKSIVISAHYDSVMDAGFCDDGAGTAGVIELARVFVNAIRTGTYEPEQSLLFICFTGEELGFVGSIEYIVQHEAEIGNISALINLDSIGQGTLQITETLADDSGLNIQQVALKAAEDMGISTDPIDAGGSDQETFRNPISVANTMKFSWKIDPQIDDSARVKSATMLTSSPLFYSDYWSVGAAGWAHTAYDNSTSTTTLGWVSPEVLGTHISVAALSVMRALAVLYSQFFLDVSVGAGIGVAVFAVIVLIERRKVMAFYRKAREEIRSYMEPREIVYSLILTAFLLFSSFASRSRLGRTEITINRVPTITDELIFGTPFEMIVLPVGSPNVRPESTVPHILWPGLILNVLIFFLISFGVTYAATRLWANHESKELTAT